MRLFQTIVQIIIATSVVNCVPVQPRVDGLSDAGRLNSRGNLDIRVLPKPKTKTSKLVAINADKSPLSPEPAAPAKAAAVPPAKAGSSSAGRVLPKPKTKTSKLVAINADKSPLSPEKAAPAKAAAVPAKAVAVPPAKAAAVPPANAGSSAAGTKYGTLQESEQYRLPSPGTTKPPPKNTWWRRVTNPDRRSLPKPPKIPTSETSGNGNDGISRRLSELADEELRFRFMSLLARRAIESLDD